MITNRTFMWRIFNPHLEKLIEKGMPYLNIYGQQIFIVEDVQAWLKQNFTKKGEEKNESDKTTA